MTLPDAERQRRSRKHRAGEHDECDRTRCHYSVTDSSAHGVPPDLALRGTTMWRAVLADWGPLTPPERLILEEACRTADRLDTIHAQLQGEPQWFAAVLAHDEGPWEVTVDKGLAAAAQQQTILARLLADLVKLHTAATPKSQPKTAPAKLPAGVTAIGSRGPARVAT